MGLLDLDAFDRAPLRREPCDFVVVPNFVRPDALDGVIDDFPQLEGPGSFDPDEVPVGPSFAKLLEELRDATTCAHFSAKFGVELGDLPLQIGVRRFAQASDGSIHNDSRNKFVTALIYFNREWTSPCGRLRILANPRDIDSQLVEVEPVRGTLLAFRRSERSYHGFKPYEGERRSLQMYWVNPRRGERGGPKKRFALYRRFKRLFKTD